MMISTAAKSIHDPTSTAGENPFDLDANDAFARWRDRKLACCPALMRDLMVEIRNPRSLTLVERSALLHRLRMTNMALYSCQGPFGQQDLRALGEQLGLNRLDANLCAGEQQISSIEVRADALRKRYIPYTYHPLSWHTDGYYNDQRHQVRSFGLHCVRQAESGGESQLLDHEIVYALFRSARPEATKALYDNDVMSIPANVENGEEIRPLVTGPVFSIDPGTGSLHMRYSARKRNIAWKAGAEVEAAVNALEKTIAEASAYTLNHRLQPGEGVISNNVLHRRKAFSDGAAAEHQRLLYRARSFDRIIGTGLNEFDFYGWKPRDNGAV